MPSRRTLIRMSQAESDEFARTQQTLIIVSNGTDGYPHPMPMWFALDEKGRFLVSTFARSQKVLNFQRDPRATLLIEDGTSYESLRGLVIKASTEVLKDADEVIDAMVAIRLKGSKVTDDERVQLRKALRDVASKRIILRFTPQSSFSWDHAKLGGAY